MILSDKIKSDNLIILDSLKIEKAKTKELANILKALPLKKISCLIAINNANPEFIRASKNLERVWTTTVKSINILELVNHRYLLVTKDSLKEMEKIFHPSQS